MAVTELPRLLPSGCCVASQAAIVGSMKNLYAGRRSSAHRCFEMRVRLDVAAAQHNTQLLAGNVLRPNEILLQLVRAPLSLQWIVVTQKIVVTKCVKN